MTIKNQILGDQREAITSKATELGYPSAFTYDPRDPYQSDILLDDPVLSHFKFARKSNYKPGLFDSLRLFSNHHNFAQFYWQFIVTGSFI